MRFLYKKIISWIIISLIFIGLVFLIVSYFSNGKNIDVLWPKGGEVLKASQIYQIRWEEKNMARVGILLVKGENPQETKWIARDIPAKDRKYDWQIFVWEETGDNYRVAVLEYPWQEGKTIAYSDFFSIVGPDFASCDKLSIEKEWPYVPSDFPGLRKIFITSASFTGDLEGLEGADKKCQQEAETKGFEGTWRAFLGDDTIFAFDRLELDGIFVQAESAAVLPEGKACHRLLGKNFEQVLKAWPESSFLAAEKLEKNFLASLSNIWLGRINKESSKDCVFIVQKSQEDLSRSYSFTTTCQNWTTAKEVVVGYPPLPEQETEFSICYTPQGLRINAVGLAGLSGAITEEGALSASTAKACNIKQKLLCLEQ